MEWIIDFGTIGLERKTEKKFVEDGLQFQHEVDTPKKIKKKKRADINTQNYKIKGNEKKL